MSNIGLASPVLRPEGLGPCLDVELSRAYRMNFETKFDHTVVFLAHAHPDVTKSLVYGEVRESDRLKKKLLQTTCPPPTEIM